jgi:hypothetical protein
MCFLNSGPFALLGDQFAYSLRAHGAGNQLVSDDERRRATHADLLGEAVVGLDHRLDLLRFHVTL